MDSNLGWGVPDICFEISATSLCGNPTPKPGRTWLGALGKLLNNVDNDDFVRKLVKHVQKVNQDNSVELKTELPSL